MNAKRIAKRIIAEKPIHWITAAARRILGGEDFDAVMQDLARQHTLHDTSAFKSIERELRARVEQERGKKASREGPDMNDRDFFKAPAVRAVADMTLEKFRSIALEVMRDKQTSFPVATRLEYIKAKGAKFDLMVDDNWLIGLLSEASNDEPERLGCPL